MSRTKDSVNLVVGCHESPWIAVANSDLERLKVNFPEGAVGNLFIDKKTTSLLIVGCEMLDASSNSLALDGIDKGASKFSSKERVFAVRFKVATAQRRPGNTD